MFLTNSHGQLPSGALACSFQWPVAKGSTALALHTARLGKSLPGAGSPGTGLQLASLQNSRARPIAYLAMPSCHLHRPANNTHHKQDGRVPTRPDWPHSPGRNDPRTIRRQEGPKPNSRGPGGAACQLLPALCAGAAPGEGGTRHRKSVKKQLLLGGGPQSTPAPCCRVGQLNGAEGPGPRARLREHPRDVWTSRGHCPGQGRRGPGCKGTGGPQRSTALGPDHARTGPRAAVSCEPADPTVPVRASDDGTPHPLQGQSRSKRPRHARAPRLPRKPSVQRPGGPTGTAPVPAPSRAHSGGLAGWGAADRQGQAWGVDPRVHRGQQSPEGRVG